MTEKCGMSGCTRTATMTIVARIPPWGHAHGKTDAELWTGLRLCKDHAEDELLGDPSEMFPKESIERMQAPVKALGKVPLDFTRVEKRAFRLDSKEAIDAASMIEASRIQDKGS